jgi:hypothetical protein
MPASSVIIANNKLDIKSDQCYPPPPHFLNGFKHISKVVLKESGGTRPLLQMNYC